MRDVVYREESYSGIGACFEVYKEKGHGFLEPVYYECMKIELTHRQILNCSQSRVPLYYRGQRLKQHYVPDFTCYDKIVLEIKTVEKLADQHRAQVLSYLNATGFQLGLPVNFGHHPRLEYERIVLTNRN
ncbi:MAG: GxxExxY protein [Verrucomicrobia bacterium]|nr:GxxExxY protein [Verrucomicrobiota bacterium]